VAQWLRQAFGWVCCLWRRWKMPSFEQWVEERQSDLMDIRGERLGLLKALERVLGEQAVDGKVRVRNFAVYRLAVDSYEMLVIDLASFFKGLLGGGGPGLTQLNNYLAKLTPGKEPRGKPTTPDEREDLALEKVQHDYRREAFAKLFPECATRQPRQEDVQKLKDRLDALSERCRKLRSTVHAHKYEREEKATALPRLKLAEIESLLGEAEDAVNGLRLLGMKSTFVYPDSTEDIVTAEDLRDIMLHGSVNAFCNKLGIGDGEGDPWYWQRRKAFYEGDGWKDDDE
jgi:hypothetical protein